LKKNRAKLGSFGVLGLITLAGISADLGASIAWAKSTPHPSPSPKMSETENQPLDTLVENLDKKFKSKQAHRIGTAYQAFQKGKLDLAAQAVRPLIHPTSKLGLSDAYVDYAHWIVFQVNRARAQRATTQKKYAMVSHWAELAFQAYLQILQTSPMSPLTRNSSKDLASVELVIADANWGLKKWKLSQSYYEKALFRLNSQNALIAVQPESFAHYAATCRKETTQTCITWLNKVKASFAARSQEVAAIIQEFPEISDQPKIKPFRAQKLYTLYRSGDLDQTAFTAALQLSLDKSYSKSAKAFDQFLIDFPRSSFRVRAKYLLANSLEKDKEPEKAKKAYAELQLEAPLTYYGLLASFKTGEAINEGIQGQIPSASETDPSLQPNEVFHLRRGQEFIAEKAYELAALELSQLKARDGLSNEFLLYLALLNSKAQNIATGLQIFSDLGQRGFEGIRTSFGLRSIFPKRHFDLIEKYSGTKQLDPILVLSLIKQESAFDELAGSSSGALGLMQLMPATALETESGIPISHLHQAEDNIRVGTAYLKKLLDRFQGNAALALAAYNAGPNAVERWLKNATPETSLTEFIESIPYKETREYVAAIIRNYFWYTYQMKGNRLQNLDQFWKPIPPPSQTKPQSGSA